MLGLLHAVLNKSALAIWSLLTTKSTDGPTSWSSTRGVFKLVFDKIVLQGKKPLSILLYYLKIILKLPIRT